jgi:hypothetical protein
MSEEVKDPDVLSTLNDIKDLLTPKPSGPIQIRSNDQAAINSHIDQIASGHAIVIPATVTPPTYGAGIKQISRTDQQAINANLDAIAKGDAVIV